MGLDIDEQFRQHLLRSFPLSESDLNRFLVELAEYYSGTVEEYVRLRHLQLQKQGMRNKAIYDTILHELDEVRFRSEPLTTRQIRRMIYG